MYAGLPGIYHLVPTGELTKEVPVHARALFLPSWRRSQLRLEVVSGSARLSCEREVIASFGKIR